MSIVNTIKALLAKAASTEYEAEAEVFLAKALELMEKYQLDHADLETDDPVAGEGYYEKGSVKAAPDWDFMLIFAVAGYFGCKACRCSSKGKWVMDLVGRESARITAKEMHKYLVTTVRKLARAQVGSREFRIVKADAWGDMVWTGEYMNADQIARRIGNALRSRLNVLAAQNHKPAPNTAAGKNALITVDRVVAVYESRHPDSKPINGSYHTTGNARKIAEGIGLNLQTGGRSGRQQIGSK